jgi:hypothetical protein
VTNFASISSLEPKTREVKGEAATPGRGAWIVAEKSPALSVPSAVRGRYRILKNLPKPHSFGSAPIEAGGSLRVLTGNINCHSFSLLNGPGTSIM